MRSVQQYKNLGSCRGLISIPSPLVYMPCATHGRYGGVQVDERTSSAPRERQMSGERRTSRSWPLARLAAKVHPVCRSGDLALHRRRRHLRVRDALYGFEVGAFARLLFKLELAFALQSLRLEAFVIADDAGKHGLGADASYVSAEGQAAGVREGRSATRTSRSRTWIMCTPHMDTPARRHEAPNTILAVLLIAVSR